MREVTIAMSKAYGLRSEQPAISAIVRNACVDVLPLLDRSGLHETEITSTSPHVSGVVFDNTEGYKSDVRAELGRITIRLGESSLAPESSIDRVGIRAETLTKASGNFAFFDILGDKVEVATDAVGTFPFFWWENELFLVISTRVSCLKASVDALARRYLFDRLQLDLPSLRSFAASGHYNFSETPFAGVHCGNPHSLFRATPRGVYQNSWLTDTPNLTEKSPQYLDIVDRLAGSLTEACEPLANSTSLTFPISGGRDSRLVAAALSAMGKLKISTATSGMPDHPDVVLGKEIATRLGWPHEARMPASVDAREVAFEDPISKVDRVLDVFDLQVSAWDDVETYGPYAETPSLSGVGGELLRGGYLATERTLPSSEVSVVKVNQRLGNLNVFSTPESWATENARLMYTQMARENPVHALDALYAENRNYRWVGARRRGASFRRKSVDPLMDNKLFTTSRLVSRELMWNERVVFDIIESLAPTLSNIPIEGSRWRFEQDGPVKDGSMKQRLLDGFEKRYAITAEPSALRFDVRRLEDETLRTEIYTYLMNSSTTFAADLFDNSLLEAYLADWSTPPRYPAFIWHMLTAARFIERHLLGDYRRSPKVLDRVAYLK